MSFLFFSLLLILGSFILSYVLIPKIRVIAKVSNFRSKPNHRSSHVDFVPNIGGVAFYVVLMISFYFIEKFDEFNTLYSLLPGLTIIFIIGLKDDLIGVAPSTKLIAQILSGVFLVFHPSFELLNFKGFLWVFEINYFIGLLIVIFINVLIINALNLIDGIDGLAGVISIIVFSSFTILFLLIERYFLCSICIVLIGSLIAFLRFNVSNEKKIFMGDTGSMLIGFIISILTLRIIALPNEKLVELNFPLQNIPFLIFSFISIPILDLVRVFVIRIFAGKSPFEADRNHFHHLIIDFFKLSHFKTSLFIGFINLVIILIFGIAIMYLGQALLFGLVFFIFISYYFLLNIISSNLDNKLKNQ